MGLFMKPDRARSAVMELLRSFGFEVSPIAEDPTRPTADLLATQDDRFLIEVKTREDDPEQLREERAQLATGEIVFSGQPYGYATRASEIIRDGVRQLKAHGSRESEFRLLWIVSTGRSPSVKDEQFRATLYGTTNIIHLRPSKPMKQAFYFRESAFFRHRKVLDGVVLTEADQHQLCINDQSVNSRDLRRSAIGSLFEGGILYPPDLEARGEIYLVDSDVDRGDSAAVKQFISSKYDCGIIDHMEMGELRAETWVDSEPVEPE